MTLRAAVVIPARNEAGDIGRCLERVLAQDIGPDAYEIIVVDGGSTDGTADVVAAVLATTDVEWTIVENPVGTTPSNLNAGLAAVRAPIVCRVDARSFIPAHYVRTCCDVLDDRPDVAVVGGAQIAIPPSDGPVGLGIARALNNRFGMGGSPYRAGAASQPTDTVYLGAFRTEQLRFIGGWDLALHSNQDFDCNRRMAAAWGSVWFESSLPVEYLPRSTVADIARQYRRFGRWKVRYWRHTGTVPSTRQRVLLALVPSAVVAGTLVLAPHGRRRRRAVVLAALTAAGLLVIEHQGSSGPDGLAASRLVGATTLVVVGVSWTVGAGLEAVRPSEP